MAQPVRTWHQFHFGDGYDFVQMLEAAGWKPISGYGLEGWDAGDWPLVVIGRALRPNKQNEWVIVERVEGDCNYRAYKSEKAQLEALDSIVEKWWRFQPESYGTDIQEAVKLWPSGKLPPRYRGEFTWARLHAHQEAEAKEATI